MHDLLKVQPCTLLAKCQPDCVSSRDEMSRMSIIVTGVQVYNIKKFDSSGIDQDDLISIGTVGLIKAVDTYQPTKGTKFATYAARCIQNEILMQLRAQRKTRKDVSLYSPIGTDKEGNEITISDILWSENDSTEDEVSKRLEISGMIQLLEILDERERRVIELRFGLVDGQEWTQNEVADLLEISRSYVSRLEKRALLKMFHQSYAGQERKKAYIYTRTTR